MAEITDAKSFIGKRVKIIIERPMGSKSKHKQVMPINYGFVPNTLSPDGSELDAYLLGIFEPVEEFEGICIAVIHRINDDDDKIVVVPEGKEYSDEQIKALTEYQERFFESVIIR